MAKGQTSYQQPIKEESRRLIWKGAIDRLTHGRGESRIISEPYVRNLWEYSLNEVLRPYTGVKDLDSGVLEEWCQFAGSEYGTKAPSDLRIAYLSGPEPENDLSILHLSPEFKRTAVNRMDNIWKVGAKPSMGTTEASPNGFRSPSGQQQTPLPPVVNENWPPTWVLDR
jgi:hypothetical protein